MATVRNGAGMARIPFGISRFDELIDGGAPGGSVVILSDELGAGAREFCYTTAMMSALAHADEDLFETYYGQFEHEVRLPPEIHYVTFSVPPPALLREMNYVLADDIVELAGDHIRFCDLTDHYFERSKVPMEWYTAERPGIEALGGRTGTRGVFGVLGSYLNEHARENVVVIDSLTDLVTAADEYMSWTDIAVLMKGLAAAATAWDGLILLLVTHEALGDEEVASLMDAAHGSLVFEWETEGSGRQRTMVVKQFRGVLSRLEDEDIIRFETDIYDYGFDITGVRKIR